MRGVGGARAAHERRHGAARAGSRAPSLLLPPAPASRHPFLNNPDTHLGIVRGVRGVRGVACRRHDRRRVGHLDPDLFLARLSLQRGKLGVDVVNGGHGGGKGWGWGGRCGGRAPTSTPLSIYLSRHTPGRRRRRAAGPCDPPRALVPRRPPPLAASRPCIPAARCDAPPAQCLARPPPTPLHPHSHRPRATRASWRPRRPPARPRRSSSCSTSRFPGWRTGYGIEV